MRSSLRSSLAPFQRTLTHIHIPCPPPSVQAETDRERRTARQLNEEIARASDVAASLAAENARLSAELDAERAAAAEAAGRLRALEADLAEARREAQFHTAQVRRCPTYSLSI